MMDIDQIRFIQSGICGGITTCVQRYVKVNNKYMKDYNPNDVSKYIMYFDSNNLYGWAMSRPLPYGGFQWVNDIESFDINTISENSDIGYILELDLESPQEIQEEHNDLPFCAQSKISPVGKQPKLICDLYEKKTNYAIHYLNLQQNFSI